jgi:RNA polymerase sigma-70 factor (ECF subfamily)
MMEPERLALLVKNHASTLVLYARQWCAAPEDVVQEAFVKLIRQTRPPDNPLGWLYRVVRNAAVSAGRSDQRRKRHENAAARPVVWFLACDENELSSEVATAALQGLPAEQREVLVAHLWGGLTFDQVGELAGCSSSTAHRWYLAGLAALRERLGVPCPSKTTTRS